MVKVLLGDDQPQVRSTISDLCEYIIQIEIETFETGEQLVDGAKTGRYDLIVTDFNYGLGINGIEVIRWIREFNPEVPIYLLTGEHNAQEKYGSTQGLTGIISKFNLSKLEEILNQLKK